VSAPLPAGVVVLADWRAADVTKRRELAAQNFTPDIYNPTKGDAVWTDLVRVRGGVHTIVRGLKLGNLKPETAAAVLLLIHDDLDALSRASETLDRKLRKAKKRAKKGRG
jgi:hypothetical protein